MSEWTHAICEACWINREGDWAWSDELKAEVMTQVRRPTVLVEPELTSCCFCNNPTIFGAYVRHDPQDLILICQGKHPSKSTEEEENTA